jgi:siderophore synthetase component
MVPCLSQQLPAILVHFPQAEVYKSIPACARAQASIRTVSIPGYNFDLKFTLACQITSAIRDIPCWAPPAGPDMTTILLKILPEQLWVFGEVAGVTGSQEDANAARHVSCIVRENLVTRAEDQNEVLILVSGLIEKPLGDSRTYAEILFDLKTTADKTEWFTRFVQFSPCCGMI